VVDTKKENGIYDPGFLKKLDNIGNELETFHEGDMFVGKAWSITTIIKEINRALNNNQMENYVLPKTREMVAQELFLFENSGSDDLLDFTDSQLSKARVVIKVPAIDAIQYSEFISHVSEQFHHEFPECDVSVTGIIVDDTIHFMHSFRRNLKTMKDSRKATIATVMVAGRAMVITSLVLSAGFFTYMFSSMNSLYYFGLLSGITMLIALVSELLLTPALIMLVYRKK